MSLPTEFENRMKSMLGDSYASFIKSLGQQPVKGLRVNLAKLTVDDFMEICPFELEKTPFCENGFIADAHAQPGKHPYHAAGLYYLQEPTAMAAVTALDPCKGDKVLDLCAAPGGKTGQIAERVSDEGFVLANEVVSGRARILASNIERLGFRNTVVSSTPVDKVCELYPLYFDKILVDAPCSGEGMFRKDDEAAVYWSEEHTLSCANRQSAILSSAKSALREGGILVYSTCTFAPCENEGVIQEFLKENPDFELLDIDSFPKSDGLFGLDGAARLYPHLHGGEGHFIAKLRKLGGGCCLKKPQTEQKCEGFTELYRDIFSGSHSGKLYAQGGYIWLLPEASPELCGLKLVWPGVQAAAVQKDRLEPCHNIFTAARPSEVKRKIGFSASSDEIMQFLRGHTLSCGERGYTAVLVDGYIAGFGKCSDGILKNKYPKGLRSF